MSAKFACITLMIFYNHIAAVFILRVFLGVLFFMQGYDKVFKVGTTNVIASFKKEMYGKNISDGLISLATYYTSFIELIAGFALIIGFAKYFALFALGLDLLIVAIAFSILKPMWDMQYVFPRLILLIALLLLPSDWDSLSVDYLIGFAKVVHEIRN